MKLIVEYSSEKYAKVYRPIVDFALEHDNVEMTTEELAKFKKKMKRLVEEADKWVDKGCVEMRDTGRRILVLVPRGEVLSKVVDIRYDANDDVKQRCRKIGTVEEKIMLRRDIVADIDKLIRAGYTTRQAFHIVGNSPAPRFYITYPAARRHVARLEKGKPCCLENERKIEQIKELHRRWKAAGGRRSSYIALMDIIEQPAPSYYVSYDSIMRFYYRK